MPQRDIINNSIVNELGGNTVAISTANNTIINNSNKSQITALLDSNTKVNYPKANPNPVIISSSPSDIQFNSQMENINNYPQNEDKNNYLTPYTYSNKNINASSPIAIKPPPPPTALNQFSFQPNAQNIYLSSTENVNAFFNNSKSSNQLETTSSYSDQSANLKDSKMGSSAFISPSSVHLLPQDNLYSQSYQPSRDISNITNGITGKTLSSSFTYKNNLLASVNTGNPSNPVKKSNVSFTKGIPICENTLIKSQRMHRKRTMRLTKQAQNEVGLFYNFDVNLLLQISLEQWVDFITITTFSLWQYSDIHPSPSFMDDAYDTIYEVDAKERNYFFAYRRFLYQFMVKSSPNPFVILYAIVYLFKLREVVPNDVVTPRSETFVFPVLVMIADKFIQDVHQLPAKYWAMAAKMDTEDLISFQRKVMKYLHYSLLVNYDEIENVVILLDQFIQKEIELDSINQDISSPSSSNSYPTPPISQQSSVDLGFSMFNDNIDSTNTLDNKEAEILIYTFRKVLNEQDEYLPNVYTKSNLPVQYSKVLVEREAYGYNQDSPAVISSYQFKKSIPVPGISPRPRLSTSAPKSNSFDNTYAGNGRPKRLSVGVYSTRSVSPHPVFETSSYDPSSSKRRSVNDPFYVYEGKNPYHKNEDLEFKKYTSGGGKKISMLSKAMNLLKNEKNKSKASKNSNGKVPSKTLPRNYKSSKFNTKSTSTGSINDHRDSPFPAHNSFSESQINYGPYFSSGKNSKRNSKSNIPPINTNRYSMSTAVSDTSQNKRYSLPIYAANNFKFNGAVDSCYSNPPEVQPQKISIINKKADGAATPEDYLFKDSTHLQNPGANLEYQRSPVKPKLIPKLVSTNDEFTPDISDNTNRSFNKSFDESQFNKSQLKEVQEGPDDYMDYNQAVNMLKSIPFGDDAIVKSIEDNVSYDEERRSENSGLKSKTSKTSFLFSKRKNSKSTIPEGGYVKKHTKSKSLFSTSSGHKKNPSVNKKFYTLGHNHSENSINTSYFEKDHNLGNYFSHEMDNGSYRIDEAEEEENDYFDVDNLPASRVEENPSPFPKRSGSSKSVKWLGKIMKTIQLKK